MSAAKNRYPGRDPVVHLTTTVGSGVDGGGSSAKEDGVGGEVLLNIEVSKIRGLDVAPITAVK